MFLIFTASADAKSYEHSAALFEPLLHWLFPRLSQDHVELAHHLFRKTCHLTEYALLAVLLWRAIHQSRKNDHRVLVAPERNESGWRWDVAGLSLTIVFAYAASDEFHQIFVPTRTPLVSDVLIDMTGGVIGLLLLWGLGKIFKHW